MVEIPLTQGQVALVDDQDARRVLAHKWHAVWIKRGGRYYAATNIRTGKVRRMYFLHRFILEAPPGMEVDHVNRNGLDNRRANLRLATRSQNAANRGRQSNNTTGFKGVSWRRNKFWASIEYQNRVRHLGPFGSAEDAARAYDTVARELHGDFAALNFSNESAD